MTVGTGALTVNAAFLLEIKEDNRELRELLEQVAMTFHKHRQVHVPPKQMVDLLGRLRDRLAMHFSLEEAFGYIEDAVAVAPRLTHQAQLLRREHADLFVEVCGLVEEAERMLYREHGEPRSAASQHVVDRYDTFSRRLQDHDARENQMILDALDDDIGVGD